MTESVGSDFPNQQARARVLLKEYQDLGPVGTFGAIMIENTIRRADEALASGDVVKIVRLYAELKDLD